MLLHLSWDLQLKLAGLEKIQIHLNQILGLLMQLEPLLELQLELLPQGLQLEEYLLEQLLL